MTTTGIMPRIADMAGGRVDPAGYARLATLFAGVPGDVPAGEADRLRTVAGLLQGAARNARGGRA